MSTRRFWAALNYSLILKDTLRLVLNAAHTYTLDLQIVEFEHETTSGRRVIRLDNVEVVRKDWMFKLVGQESFKFGNKNAHQGVIQIDAVGGFSYQYSLIIDGKPYKIFRDQISKIQKAWILPVNGKMYRIVLEKDKMDIWINGDKVETAAEFVDDGTETHFTIGGNQPAHILNISKKD